MKQTMKRLGALGLALLLGALGSIPALAAELPEKDEVIYVNLSPEGEAGAIYVVNSYDLPAETTVTDYGNYRRVKNLTTTAPLTQEGKKITFTAPAGKFYYQGELDSARTGELPWRVAVRYFLDGKETPGQELAGASGRLEMRVSLRQNPEADPVWAANHAPPTSWIPKAARTSSPKGPPWRMWARRSRCPTSSCRGRRRILPSPPMW